jgi:CheY-like chemotaxis protein
LLERVRELRPEVPVLLTSGYSEEPSKDRPRAPAQAFLRKPYRQAELGRALVEAIRIGRIGRIGRLDGLEQAPD